MADLTPEQREAALEAIRRLWVRRAYTTDQDFMNYAIDALLSHGWRAPGPPTEEEVERAVGPTAAALAAVYGSTLGHLSPTHVELYERDARVAARAALTAALGRPE